jgi:general nucleoside transport system ATP-binding protein
LVGTAHPATTTNAALARLMVGADLTECRLTPREPGAPRLSLKRFSRKSWDPFGTTLDTIDLEVRSGEIVGIAGVSGNGQKELLAAISGEAPGADAGSIEICGEPAQHLQPAPRRSLGLTFVPEERLGRGAVPPMSLAQNALLTGARTGLVRSGFVRASAARAFAKETIAAFNVKCGSELSPAESLSGGNLQKFIVGREIRLDPKVMVVAQPTWGVDVGAAQLIHRALMELRDRGVAVLVVSEELDELFTLCDRIAVLAQGRLSQPQPTATLTVEQVGVLMGGVQGDVADAGAAAHA